MLVLRRARILHANTGTARSRAVCNNIVNDSNRLSECEVRGLFNRIGRAEQLQPSRDKFVPPWSNGMY
jgi:hypothetical protein